MRTTDGLDTATLYRLVSNLAFHHGHNYPAKEIGSTYPTVRANVPSATSQLVALPTVVFAGSTGHQPCCDQSHVEGTPYYRADLVTWRRSSLNKCECYYKWANKPTTVSGPGHSSRFSGSS